MSSSSAKAKPKAKKSVLGEADQSAFLRDCKKRVDSEAFFMKRSLDNGKLYEALKHASNMIGQLRTGLLSPSLYYELYIATFTQLHHLQSYLADVKEGGEKMSHLYELVQYAGNILPRLYLLITVGAVYIKSKEAPAKDVLKDLVEMCKGVQHPLRGLFLRHYLSEMAKDKLPDSALEYSNESGDIHDCIDFIIHNFIEMNKLWVRLQHQGTSSDLKKREKDRSDLRLLVGTNLARLSQLDGVNTEIYKTEVLPKLLEQIVSCKDVMAQQYLMECIIQVFPDEFHLNTLDKLLNTCAQLQSEVNIKAIIVALVDRLALFASSEEGRSQNIDVFSFFYKHLSVVIQERPNMPPQDSLELIAALMNLTMEYYPDNLDYVNRLLVFATDVLETLQRKGIDLHTSHVNKQLIRLLHIPLKRYKNIITVLNLEQYPVAMKYLSYNSRKKVSMDIARNAIQNATKIPTADTVNQLFEFISPLIRDQDDQPPFDDWDMEDFEEEQQMVAALVHLFENEDLKELSAMYVTARKHFGQGATVPQRIKYTLPPLIFSALGLAYNLREEELVAKKVFKFVHETISALAKHDQPDLSLNLFLNAALTSSACNFEEIAYEFVTQAFVIYEDSITESKAQFSAMQLFIGGLQKMTCFDRENAETLIMKTVQCASRLLKKPDQCRAVYMCAHLFSLIQEEKRVLECLQKAVKIADSCMDADINLFLEILDQCLFFFGSNDHITTQYLDGLVELINTNMENKEVDERSDVSSHYRNTFAFYQRVAGKSSGNTKAAE